MGKKIKKIDIYEKTHRILYSFGAIVKFVSFLCVKKEHVKIIKKGKLPKPPYFLLSNHASFMDIYVAMVATGIHRPYWVCAAEEFVDKNFVCRWSGVMPKRRYIADARSNQMMMDILTKRKKVLVMYPESIWSYAGITERFDHNVAKFAKHARVPIVFINCHGHYLRQPQWGDQKIRKVSPMYAEVKTLLTKKQIDNFSFEDIDEAITQAMQYDEEQYQLDNNIKIDYPKRAEGLENLLYKCPHCGKEYEMTSKDDVLSCKACGVSYRLKEDGTLECLNNPAKFHRISEWYLYEKDCVKQEIDAGTYHFEDDVRVEHLLGVGVGYQPIKGHHHMVHDIHNGITISGDNFSFNRPAKESFGLHTDYYTKGKGPCFELATKTESYYIYPLNKKYSLTKLRFAVDILYDIAKKN